MENGLLTNEELAEQLIVELNNLPRLLINGQFIGFCSEVSRIGQGLKNLRNGIANDTKSMQEQIECLKKRLQSYGDELNDASVEELLEDNNG